jgi:hypothetical protein
MIHHAKGKEAFIGVWQARSGFKVDIKKSGTADVYEFNLPQNSDNMKLIIGIAITHSKEVIL